MLKICIAGATGFIGKNLIAQLEQKEDIEIIALSRRISHEMDGAKKGNVTWRRCNGFSMIDVEEVTKDVDILIYLIHSMLPSSSLTQGGFSCFDLYLADNFSRACHKNNVKKIIYLSGIIPKDGAKLSNHLKSRLEVEKILSLYNNDTCSLRAGLIIGKGGSSFKILEKLVKRLPILICPPWTKTKTQPIDLQDVLASIQFTIKNYDKLEKYYDIGSNEVMTYEKMLQLTAQELNRNNMTLHLPIIPIKLSKLWVSKITGSSSNLVYPLVESLKHNMVVDNDKRLLLKDHDYRTFSDSLKEGLNKNKESFVRSIINYNQNINLRWLKTVTSIQRLSLKSSFSSKKVAEQYFDWLNNSFFFLLKIIQNDDEISFRLFGILELLRLKKSYNRSNQSRSVYYIINGLLAHQNQIGARLEFRKIEYQNTLVIALIDFRPSIPWFIYKYTQALVHLNIMNRFKSYLKAKYA
ncbi:MAG: NAD(P)H-binding protein [Bacteriovoracaceae bacterium]|jgi:nucleoside-diphosphate-sugar epimerase|nr:NAD(P)H-binding protein [Bacteriovoracaceae bacterium]